MDVARASDESVPTPAAGVQARSSLEKRRKSAKSAGYQQVSAAVPRELQLSLACIASSEALGLSVVRRQLLPFATDH